LPAAAADMRQPRKYLLSSGFQSLQRSSPSNMGGFMSLQRSPPSNMDSINQEEATQALEECFDLQQKANKFLCAKTMEYVKLYVHARLNDNPKLQELKNHHNVFNQARSQFLRLAELGVEVCEFLPYPSGDTPSAIGKDLHNDVSPLMKMLMYDSAQDYGFDDEVEAFLLKMQDKITHVSIRKAILNSISYALALQYDVRTKIWECLEILQRMKPSEFTSESDKKLQQSEISSERIIDLLNEMVNVYSCSCTFLNLQE